MSKDATNNKLSCEKQDLKQFKLNPYLFFITLYYSMNVQ